MEERKEHETDKRNERWRIGKERNRKKGIREERNGTERKEYDTKEMKEKKRIGIEWRI